MPNNGAWSYATVSSVTPNINIIGIVPDGQTASINVIAQYPSPAVGDRVTTLRIGRQIYATGTIN